MKRPLAPLLSLCAAFAVLSACANGEPAPQPAPRLELAPGALEGAVLEQDDVGDGWTQEENAAPSTLQVGGEVGPANVQDAEQEATSAFQQEDDSGYVTNSVFLVEDSALAEALMLAHRQATEEKWTQERKDGGGSQFRRTGEVSGLPALGDEMYSARINAAVRSASGSETKRKIEYVVYRIDRLLAFVVAQDIGVGKYIRLQEQKVARLVS